MPFFLKIEKGIISDLYKYLNQFVTLNSRILFITDNLIYQKYGNVVIKQLSSFFENIESIIIQENTISKSFELTSKILSNEIELIVGMGGGKVIDVCKHAAFMSKIKFLSIPTALAHDGVASPIAVLETENGIKSLGCKVPSGIIIDLEIIRDSPILLKKAGIGDTLSNFTAILDWKNAENKGFAKINDFALLLSDTSFHALLNYKNKDLNDFGFLKQLAESVVLSGLAMNIEGSSRPCSGSEHLISHAMDSMNRNNLHGMQVAVSSIVTAYIFKQDISILRKFLRTFDLPETFEDLGFDINDFIVIMQNAISTRPNRYTILNETDLSENNLKKMYKNLYK
jgi:glycerol-1-phosphate dehydrogenase [NAD(P)+]